MTRSLIVLLAALLTTSVGALEIEQGDLRVHLDERNARFSLSVRQDGRWTSLLFPQDVRTSATDILEGNQVHRMGDSGRFSQEVSQGSEYGPEFIWQSPTLTITQSFEFVRGQEAVRVNGVQIRTRITSTAERSRTVAVRFLLDTWLGEGRNLHFLLPGGQIVENEMSVDPRSTSYIRSVSTTDSGVGLQLMLDDPAVTPPGAVFLANWQRASVSAWDFEHNPTRNFNRLPYSINDSAILITYPAVELSRGESYEVVMQIGDLTATGYTSPAVVAAEEDLPDAPDEQTVLLARLAQLINEIAAVSLDEDMDMADILRLQEELQRLGEQIRGR